MLFNRVLAVGNAREDAGWEQFQNTFSLCNWVDVTTCFWRKLIAAYRLSEIGFDAEPELFVLLSHLKQVLEPLLEFPRPLSGAINIGNSDALIRVRIALKALPGLGVRLQGVKDVVGDGEPFRGYVAVSREHVFADPVLLDEAL